MIKEAIIRALSGIKITVEYENYSINRKMSERIEKIMGSKLQDYLREFS
jgi:hypothetical protein